MSQVRCIRTDFKPKQASNGCRALRSHARDGGAVAPAHAHLCMCGPSGVCVAAPLFWIIRLILQLG